MRRKTFGFIAVFVGLSLIICKTHAQNSSDPVLMTIDGQPVRVSEFLNIYSKNNVQSEVADKKSMEEYLELFINFKLKVRDAEVNGLDTVKVLKDELAGYRKQLSASYFIDSVVFRKLVNEAYERMQWDLRASHILLRCDKDASPSDTLATWKRMDEILRKACSGEPFERLEFNIPKILRPEIAKPLHNILLSRAIAAIWVSSLFSIWFILSKQVHTALNQAKSPISCERILVITSSM